MERIAVTDLDPVVARGVAAILEGDGYSVEIDPPNRSGFSVIVSGNTRAEQSKGGSLCPVVAIIPSGIELDYLNLLRDGVTSIVPQAAAAESISWAVRATMDGLATVPTSVVRSLLLTSPRMHASELLLSELDLQMLGSLAAGIPISQLAADLAYSERETYRLLNSLYHRIGVKNRAGAIAVAGRWGLELPS